MKDDNVIILNPTLEDLLEGNIYKLDIFEKEFYIPLWHQELYYDNIHSQVMIKNLEKDLDEAEVKIEYLLNLTRKLNGNSN